MRVSRRPVVAAVLAAVALTACSSSKSDKAVPAATTVPASTATTTAAPAPATELVKLIVTTIPSGFVLQPDDVGDTGPSDLAKAVRDDAADNAEEALRSEGFLRGYQQLWVGPDGAEIIVFLYEFATPAGAVADYERNRPLLSGEGDDRLVLFTVDGIPADHSAAAAGSAPDLSVAVVLFAKGAYNVQVQANAPTLSGLKERASSIAKDQYSRL